MRLLLERHQGRRNEDPYSQAISLRNAVEPPLHAVFSSTVDEVCLELAQFADRLSSELNDSIKNSPCESDSVEEESLVPVMEVSRDALVNILVPGLSLSLRFSMTPMCLEKLQSLFACNVPKESIPPAEWEEVSRQSPFFWTSLNPFS